ncbi:hypothetical protein NDU88_000075 [Pleurodeles waltl]|uniref:Katanin p80 subunit C-terminal domain-containing protein n=1 Tax=Pleurodeles waltl TaxID=8319 RepID=A0AAV7MH34_PLEWA|nr:hypothetical protein NDU88_000075 [Pleurodeles waltl]
MRKDKKPVQEKSAFFRLRTTANWAVSSPRKSYRIIQAKRRTPRLSLSPRSRRRTLPVTGDRDMANKENEVAFGGNLQEKLLKESRTYLLNSSDPGTSQTDGPSSKYSSFFTEVSSHHDTMTQVLFSRNLRLSVALTFWRRQNICELTAYLLRIEDLSVLADCLPMLTNSIQEEKAYVSPGCCVDLMPMVTKLITRPYEDYKLVGLNWLQAVLRRWWLELSGDSQTQEDGSQLRDPCTLVGRSVVICMRWEKLREELCWEKLREELCWEKLREELCWEKLREELCWEKLREELRWEKLREELRWEKLREELRWEKLREELRWEKLREELRWEKLREELRWEKLREELREELRWEKLREELRWEELRWEKLREELRWEKLREELRWEKLREELRWEKLREELRWEKLREELRREKLKEDLRREKEDLRREKEDLRRWTCDGRRWTCDGRRWTCDGRRWEKLKE